jgi:hypothetical protein
MSRARPRTTIRVASIAGLGAVLMLASCATDAAKAPVALPDSGRAYRALADAKRLAVAESCCNRAAAHARGVAARQLRAIDATALREQLDDAFTIIPDQRRPVAEVCAARLPFVTPGTRLSFASARGDGAGRFAYETNSDVPLTIRGRATPAPGGGRVVATRETGGRGRYAATIDADGHFVISRIHLRKIADNTFALTIDAPPNATRKVHSAPSAWTASPARRCRRRAEPPSRRRISPARRTQRMGGAPGSSTAYVARLEAGAPRDWLCGI